MKPRKIALLVALSLASAPTICLGASDAEVDELVKNSRLLKHRYEEQQITIWALEHRIKELEQRASSTSLSETRGRGTPSNSFSPSQTFAQANNDTAPQSSSTETEKSAQPSPGIKPGSIQAQAITTTQGTPLFNRKYSLEMGLTNNHYDKRNLVLSGFLALDSILLGQINLRQVKTDELRFDLTGRANVTDRISVDLNVPWIYRTAKIYSPGLGMDASNYSQGSSETGAIGDVNAGVYYHFAKDLPGSADWIGSFRIKAPTGENPYGIKMVGSSADGELLVPNRQPTGDGVWSASLGLTAIKTFDPVVMFANVGYSYNFERSFSDLSARVGTTLPGDVKLGNAFSYGVGFALALNEQTAVTFSYANTIQQSAKIRASGGSWQKVVGSDSNAAYFNTNLTHQISKNLTAAINLSVGLSPDAPDYSFGMKFPYTF